MRRVRIIATGAVLSVLPACGVTFNIGGPPTGGPTCPARTERAPDRLSGPLILSAQSVPTATLVPCLHALPAGWTLHDAAARRGQASIVLDFGRDNDRAATVTLSRTCDVTRATGTATDEPGTSRYERVDDVPAGYRAERYYVFSGGCVRYEFNLRGATGPEQVSTISRALGFVDRAVLRRLVHERSHGRFELDPASDGSPR
ncbi:MAG: hypothetical protein ACRDVG_12605 [Jatrophihabitantaceae bacterium]